MKRHALLYFVLGVVTVVSLGAVSLSGDGITFPDGSTQTTAAPGDSRRAFYLTQATFTGDQVTGAGVCADGFHFASMWEIVDVSNLKWDVTRGSFTGDSGEGPIVSWWGWVRTGGGPDTGTTTGSANCGAVFAWDSSSASDWGTAVQLPSATLVAWHDPATRISPWSGTTFQCSVALGVWCVEDSPGSGG